MTFSRKKEYNIIIEVLCGTQRKMLLNFSGCCIVLLYIELNCQKEFAGSQYITKQRKLFGGSLLFHLIISHSFCLRSYHIILYYSAVLLSLLFYYIQIKYWQIKSKYAITNTIILYTMQFNTKVTDYAEIGASSIITVR